jgi:plasmid stability protein
MSDPGCYHAKVRQLITRMDDELHERLKTRAAAEGRSVNALVNDVLTRAIAEVDPRMAVRARVAAADLRVEVRPDRRPPSRAVAIASTRGAGSAASEALAAERARR